MGVSTSKNESKSDHECATTCTITYTIFVYFMKEYFYDVSPYVDPSPQYISLYSLSGLFYSYVYNVLKYDNTNVCCFSGNVYTMMKKYVTSNDTNPHNHIHMWGYITGEAHPKSYDSVFISGIRLRKLPIHEGCLAQSIVSTDSRGSQESIALNEQ